MKARYLILIAIAITGLFRAYYEYCRYEDKLEAIRDVEFMEVVNAQMPKFTKL